MRKLDFVIAGVQKGGTTALWHFLKQHPQIRFGPRKEMHFFDNENLDWTNPDYEILHQHYSDVPEDCILGDATPIYSFWPPCPGRIHAYNANIKMIVLLREPVARAWSNWRMETARGNEGLSFSEAIRSGRERIVETLDGEKCHRIYSYVERGFYARQLDRIYSLFATEQVMVIKSSDLKLRHQSLLDEVCDFLNVRRFVSYPADETVFETRLAVPAIKSSGDVEYLNSIYQEDRHRLQTKYGIDFAKQLERE